MLNEHYFRSREQAEAYLSQHGIIAIITEYTIFKLDAETDRVIFRCLHNKHTFEVLYEQIQSTVSAKKRDFTEALLSTVITYCTLIAKEEGTLSYPVCAFEEIDDLLDWFLAWQKYSEDERLEYLEGLEEENEELEE